MHKKNSFYNNLRTFKECKRSTDINARQCYIMKSTYKNLYDKKPFIIPKLLLEGQASFQFVYTFSYKTLLLPHYSQKMYVEFNFFYI